MKEYPQNIQNSVPDTASSRSSTDLFALESNDISFVNGMLYFVNREAVDRVRHSLIEIAKDTSIIIPYLRSKGIVPNVDSDVNYPSNPACSKFNERFNFTSLFTYIETMENAILDSGGDISDFPKPTIVDPYFRAILNQFNEYKIKRLYYKLVDNDHFFVVTNNDLNALYSLRGVEDLLHAEMAPNVILIDTRVQEDLDTYSRLIEGDEFNSCIIAFSVHNVGSNTFKFTNTSVNFNGPIDPSQVSWRIYNGLHSIIATATGNEFQFTVPSNAVFPLSVELAIANPCYETRIVQFAECPTPFNIASLSAVETVQGDISNAEQPNVQFTLGLEGITGDYQVVWSFLDGSSNLTTNVTYPNPTIVNHKFPTSNGNQFYNVCATVTSAGNCSKQICKTYNFGCGVTPDDLDHNWVTPQFKFRTEMYIDNGNNSSYYGVKLTCYRKKGNTYKRSPFETLNLHLGGFGTTTPLLILGDCGLLSSDGIISANNASNVHFTDNCCASKLRVRSGMYKCRFDVIENGSVLFSKDEVLY
jgi:hypothetical protein